MRALLNSGANVHLSVVSRWTLLTLRDVKVVLGTMTMGSF
jgi:hypothetical protein